MGDMCKNEYTIQDVFLDADSGTYVIKQQQQHPFNGPFSRTTRVSLKGKTNLVLLEQDVVSGSGISWAICKSAPRPRQITMPAPHHSVFHKSNALPATQPTASKH